VSKRSITSVKKSCDVLWSQIIRAGGYCEKCGARPEKLDAHHVYGRTNHRLRWDLRNGVALCYRCHIHWAEEYPLEFAAWFAEHRPDDVVYLADVNRLGLVKRTLADYVALREELLRLRGTA
jgi:hypothetical protein